MAFRALSFGGKMVVMGVGATAAGAVLSLWTIPYYKDVYKTLWNVYEIPRFKREYVVEAWHKLQEQSNNDSLLKKHLTENLMHQLKRYKTAQEGNVMLIIQEALDNPKNPVGASAPDPQSYDVFRKLFDPIISDLHNGSNSQPSLYWGERKLDYFEPIDKDQKYVDGIRLECCRSFDLFTFHPLFRETDYYVLETAAERAFFHMVNQKVGDESDPDLKGSFFSLKKLPANARSDLERANLMFNNDNERLKASGVYKFWPIGRGVFYNDRKNLVVWVNEEEHLKFISTEKGDNVKAAMERLIKVTNAIDSEVPFARHKRLGNVSYNPSNLGTGLTATFDVRLSRLSGNKDFQEICEKLNLTCQDSGGGRYAVSNKAKLGLSEFETVKSVYDGVKKLIELEQGGGDSSSVEDKRKK